MDEELWSAYDAMGTVYQQHAADSAYNAHYDRPAVLAALGPVSGLRVLDAACGPGFYTRQLLDRGDAALAATTAHAAVCASRCRDDAVRLATAFAAADRRFAH